MADNVAMNLAINTTAKFSKILNENKNVALAMEQKKKLYEKF